MVRQYATDGAILAAFRRVEETCKQVPASYFAIPQELHFENRYGVYIIWHGGSEFAVVYVGQGNIKDRLAEHRRDQEIQNYASLDLYVTWATVGAEHRNGVERYLADIWHPKVGAAHPTAEHIVVNAPW